MTDDQGYGVSRTFGGVIPTPTIDRIAQRSATHMKHVEALKKWNPSELPKWLDEDFYRQEILSRLSEFTVKAIRLELSVSHLCATPIKRGQSIPTQGTGCGLRHSSVASARY